jgi:hypothetical protein
VVVVVEITDIVAAGTARKEEMICMCLFILSNDCTI